MLIGIAVFAAIVIEWSMPLIGTYEYKLDEVALHVKPRIFGTIPWRGLTVPFSRMKRIRRTSRSGSFNLPFVTWGNLYHSLFARGVTVDLKTKIPVSIYIAPADTELALLRQVATTQGIERGPGI